MMKHLIIILLCLTCSITFAQSKKELKKDLSSKNLKINSLKNQNDKQSKLIGELQLDLFEVQSELENAQNQISFQNEEIEKLKNTIEERIIKPEWKKVLKRNTIVSYSNFFKKYPQSNYAILAEENAWEKAYSKKTIVYFKRYLEYFPNGRNVEKAIEEITKLEIALEESKGKFSGKLPDQVDQIKESFLNSDENSFTIINMTRDIGKKEAYKLKVSFKGNTDKGYVNGSYEVSIDDCTERIFEPGKYFFVIETLANSNIKKFRNTEAWTFNGSSRTKELQIGVFSRWHIDPLIITEEDKQAEQKRTLKLHKKYYNCWSKEYKDILNSY